MDFKGISWSNALFIGVEILDLEDVFPFLLDDISISTYYRKVMATTLSLLPTTPKTTSLLILVFFAHLALVDGRLLRMFATIYVSRKGIIRLIPSKVFLLLFCKLVFLEALEINFLGV